MNDRDTSRRRLQHFDSIPRGVYINAVVIHQGFVGPGRKPYASICTLSACRSSTSKTVGDPVA